MGASKLRKNYSTSQNKKSEKLGTKSTSKVLHFNSADETNDRGIVKALNRVQAIIEFNLDGTILTANNNFLKTLGYDLTDIQGQHHSIFCDPNYVQSNDYKMFWEKLKRGEFEAGEFKRIGKNGEEVWISASYNPIFNSDGVPYKVVKFATDITESKLRNAEFEGKINAIDKVQARIEFNLDGTILTANENFLKTFGYNLTEIEGQHHKMFCDPKFVQSNDYKVFWENLRRGEFETGEFKRFDKNGEEIWILASYNPILNAAGVPYKVVKFATNITALKKAIAEIEKTAEILNSEAETMISVANEMNESSESTTARAESAAASTEQVSNGIRNVAASTEEMVASIKEIANSASHSSKQSSETLIKVRETNVLVEDLGQSSDEIGSIIKVINTIAQQTNLLALNATIEAARAGDAGKGFAVVANEVKELAKQTANATKEIANKISAIQNNSGSAIKAIGDIADSVEKMNEIASTIAAAVEEQNATTAEVAQIINESSDAVGEIADVINEVTTLAKSSAEKAKLTVKSSESLNQLSDNLRTNMATLQSH